MGKINAWEGDTTAIQRGRVVIPDASSAFHMGHDRELLLMTPMMGRWWE